MSRQLEQTLLSLIPTYSSDLPPQLVSVASSLLAQSKLNASVLKPEEEVARLYACAHLACNRYGSPTFLLLLFFFPSIRVLNRSGS